MVINSLNLSFDVLKISYQIHSYRGQKLKSEDWFGKKDPESRPKKCLGTETGSSTLIFCVTQV